MTQRSKLDIGQPVMFSDKDYQGCLNLKVADKYLILKAMRRCNFVRDKMAKEIGYSVRTLYRKLVEHGLEDVFFLYNRGTLIDSEIKKIEDNYPEIVKKDEFTKMFY